MRVMFKVFVAVMLTLTVLNARVIRVPGDQPTIQAGIDAATCDGDTVLVADGIYSGVGNKNINFKGKAIVVISENGPTHSIIDCEKSGRGFYFHSGEDANSVLTGFKIMNGYPPENENGGAICCENSSSPVIDNCFIFKNEVMGVYGSGGGISVINSAPRISNCTIQGNSAPSNQGGINSDNSSPVIVNCAIIENSSWNAGGLYCRGGSPSIKNCVFIRNKSNGHAGGAITCYNSNLTIINCTISRNIGTEGPGGIKCYNQSTLSLINTIVEGNIGKGGIYLFDNLSISISYSDFYTNENGNFTGTPPPELGKVITVNFNGDSCDQFFNIFLGPEFASTVGDSAFHLTKQSPCIDAGAPDTPHDPDSTIADMGAFYFHQTSTWIKNQPKFNHVNTPSLSVYDYNLSHSINIVYSIPEESYVTLMIYDLFGKKICTLGEGYKSVGEYNVNWDNTKISSGTYYIKLTAGNISTIAKTTVFR